MTFPTDLPAREAYILAAVEAHEAETSWSEITSSVPGHSASFSIMADALKIEGVRVNVSARLQQQIADLLGCSLMTARLSDLRWMQRSVTLLPFTRPITSDTPAMIEQSAKLDAALTAQGNPVGIVGTVGKHWLLDQALATPHLPNMAINYGWHATRAAFSSSRLGGIPIELGVTIGDDKQYLAMVQGRGSAHNFAHVDYSQVCVLVARACVADGTAMDLLDLLKDPVLAPLASHSGRMTVFRQPGVTELPLVSV